MSRAICEFNGITVLIRIVDKPKTERLRISSHLKVAKRYACPYLHEIADH
jgi:hypothetical protein